MSTNQTKVLPAPKKAKVKKILPAVVLVTTFYYSMYLLTIGLVVGYLASKIYCKKLGIDEENGDEKKIFIDLGSKWQIHVHHWIMGAIFLVLAWIVDSFYLPMIVTGFILGVMAHDIYDFNDWYQIILKKEEAE